MKKTLWGKDNLYIIAAIGLNHNGSIVEAKYLCKLAYESGFNAVKFQLRSKRLFLNINGARDIGSEIFDDFINKTFIDYKGYQEISNYCEELGITIFFSVWDLESIKFAEKLNTEIYKIASPDINNFILIDKVIELKKPLIFSTGMSTEKEINNLIKYLRNKKGEFSILHCHSAYPSPNHHLNLNYIKVLYKKGNFDVGYSSHDQGELASIAAVALGVKIIEKHITLNRKAYGKDNLISLEPKELKNFTSKLREVYLMLGSDYKQRKIGPGEKFNKIALSKSIITKANIKKGNLINSSLIDFYPSGEGLSAYEFEKYKNKSLLKDVKKGKLLTKDLFIKDSKRKNFKNLNKHLFGIPVRYRDLNNLSKKINTNYLEIHLSKNDIFFEEFTIIKDKILDKIIGFHSPDIYANNLIFDPTNENKNTARRSSNEFENVLKHIKKFHISNSISYKLNCVTSFSCYSENSHKNLRENEYEAINLFISKFEKKYPMIKILPQTLPPLAWYLGGQRYVNTFAKPSSILRFCKKYNKLICLDISHLYMACNYFHEDFTYWAIKILPHTKHLHLSGANGIDDEGINLDKCPEMIIFLKYLLSNFNSSRSFIVETWQGHLNNGEGFKKDLNYLEKII